MDKDKDFNEDIKDLKLNSYFTVELLSETKRFLLRSTRYEDALELTGYGTFSYLATTACSLVFVHALFEMVALAYVITPAECDLRLTVSEKSWINSAVFIGMLTTSIPWGIMGDKFGRRMIILPAVLGSVTASFASSLCSSFYLLFLFRLLSGIMVSASIALVLVYLGELQDMKHRDRSIAIAITSAQLSLACLPAAAWLIIPWRFTFKIRSLTISSWRVFMWLWGVVGLSGATIIVFLPESPRYVFSAKGPDDALPILAKIYSWNRRTNASSFPVRWIAAEAMKKRGSFFKDLHQLLKAPLRRCIFLTHIIMFICFALSNGIYIWVPDLLNAALSRSSQYIGMCSLINKHYFPQYYEYMGSYHMVMPQSDGDACTADNVNWVVYPTFIILELVFLLPFLFVIMCIDKFNKPWLCCIIMLVTSVALVVSVAVPQCLVAMGFFLIGLACGCCDCIVTALTMDAFPTSLRGLATCTMFMVGQLGAIVGTSVVGFMADWACHVILIVLAAICSGSALALVAFWPNTDDIRKEMERKKFAY